MLLGPTNTIAIERVALLCTCALLATQYYLVIQTRPTSEEKKLIAQLQRGLVKEFEHEYFDVWDPLDANDSEGSVETDN